MNRIFQVFLLLVAISAHVHAQSCVNGYSGTLQIGAAGRFATLTAAVDSLHAFGVKGAVRLEIRSDYQPAAEKYPVVFRSVPCATASWNIVITPAAETPSVVLESAVAGGVLQFIGANHFQILGKGKLTVRNQYEAAGCLNITGEASGNKFEEIIFRNNGNGPGISFSGVSFSNRIEQCSIGPDNGITASTGIGIYARGAPKHGGNVLHGNRVHATGEKGIVLDGNNEGWTISGNHLYGGGGAFYTGISATGEGNFYINIRDNKIGGTAPDCGGSPMVCTYFMGIEILAVPGEINDIQGNVIDNIRMEPKHNYGSYEFTGIWLREGDFRCGTETGNRIGSGNATASIHLVNNLYQITRFTGISCGDYMLPVRTPSWYNISNNQIGGILNGGNQTNLKFYFSGVEVTAGKQDVVEIRKNIISDGHPYTKSNLMSVRGISAVAMPDDRPRAPWQIDSNKVFRMSGSSMFGINIRNFPGGSINGNEVTGNTTTHDYSGYFHYGMLVDNDGEGTSISGNRISNLVMDGSDELTGMQVSTSRSLRLEGNHVHSLESGVGIGPPIRGITLGKKDGIGVVPGQSKIYNNIIRLGLNAAGKNVENVERIYGLSVAMDSSRVVHNTIHIQGSGRTPATAFRYEAASAGAGVVRNNIFSNVRLVTEMSTNFVTNFCLSASFTAEAARAAGPNFINHNIYYTAGQFKNWPFSLNDAGGKDLRKWRELTGLDTRSFLYDPGFVNPEGGAVEGDLHLRQLNPAEGMAWPDADVTKDFDGEIRSALSPSDIGADAGVFVLQDGDAPDIAHGRFFGQALASEVRYKVEIHDVGGGIDTTGNNKPRMWYRHQADTTRWLNISGSLSSGDQYAGEWEFPLDLRKSGMQLAAGDSIEYYFTAQDLGPVINLGYSNIPGTKHSHVDEQVSPPDAPLRLVVFTAMPDSVFVGKGERFTSLTNDSGFFHMAGSMLFDTSRNVNRVVVITSDLEETGKHAFNYNNEGAGPIIFCTNTPNVKKISGSIENGAMLWFNNIRNVTIDGRVKGAGSFLHIENRFPATYANEAGCVVRINGECDSVTIRNVAIFGGNAISEVYMEDSLGALVNIRTQRFGKLRIDSCRFSGLPTPTAPRSNPLHGLYISAGDADSLLITRNEFVNIRGTGVHLAGSGTAKRGYCLVDSNHIFQEGDNSWLSSNSEVKYGIYAMAQQLDYVIRNNYIGGGARFCAGAPFGLYSGTVEVGMTGIRVNAFAGSALVHNNVISNFNIEYRPLLTGIYVNGSDIASRVYHNHIGGIGGDSLIRGGHVRGILIDVSTGELQDYARPSVIVDSNRITGVESGLFDGIVIVGAQSVANVKDNVIDSSKAEFIMSGIKYEGEQYVVIEGNRISGLRSDELLTGIWHASRGFAHIARNRVYDIGLSDRKDSSWAHGILAYSDARIVNNFVHLTGSPRAEVSGIMLASSKYGSTLLFNTVYIGGENKGRLYSAAFINKSDKGIISSNVFYNDRTGGKNATVVRLMQESAPGVYGRGNGYDHNLYISRDASAVNTNLEGIAVPFSEWVKFTPDSSSTSLTVAQVPKSGLFMDLDGFDPRINGNHSLAWIVNGKALAWGSETGDIFHPDGVRPVHVVDGAPDIGAHELRPAVPPAPMTVAGNHVPGGTEHFYENGRLMASITWGTGGTLPALGPARYFSGEKPNNITNNNTAFFAQTSNAYWDFPASGGSNYSYSIRLYYDTAILGGIYNEDYITLNKKESGPGGTWKVVPSVTDTYHNTVFAQNLTSFSEFALSFSNATLATGMPVAQLQLSAPSAGSGTISTGFTFTASVTEKNTGKGMADTHKILVMLSKDRVPGPGDSVLGELNAWDYLYTGQSLTFTGELAVPCMLPGDYYLIFTSDSAHHVREMERGDNTQSIPVKVIAGVQAPVTPLITATRFFENCLEEKVRLSIPASPGCTYTWSNGKTGTEIVTVESGEYTVTVRNGCGTASASADVTILPYSGLKITANTLLQCEGAPVVLHASGAASYTWSGDGLDGKTGAVQTVNAMKGSRQYTVTGMRDGCEGKATIIVSGEAAKVPAVSIQYTGCSTGNLVFNAQPVNGGSGPQYTWYVDNIAKGGGPDFHLPEFTKGQSVHTVMRSSAKCVTRPEVASGKVVLDCVVTAIDDIDGMESFTVFPNPVTSTANFRIQLSVVRKARLVVRNINGTEVFRKEFQAYGTMTVPVTMEDLPAGIYIAELVIGKQHVVSKIVKL